MTDEQIEDLIKRVSDILGRDVTGELYASIVNDLVEIIENKDK